MLTASKTDIESLQAHITAPTLSNVWDERYSAHLDDNPTRGDALTTPEILYDAQKLHFIKRILDIELKALSRCKNVEGENLHKILVSLKDINEIAIQESQNIILQTNYDHPCLGKDFQQQEVALDEAQEKFLKALERKLTHEGYNAIKIIGHNIAHGMSHVIEELKEHPKFCAAFGALGSATFVWLNKAVGQKGYMDPAYCVANDMDVFDAMDGDINVDELALDFSCVNNIDTDRVITPHSEIQRVLGVDDETATKLLEYDVVQWMFPTDGSRYDTFVYDAQSTIVWAYEVGYDQRYEFTLYDSTMDLGNKILPHGESFDAFTAGARHSKELWTGYDWIENIAIHPPMFIFSAITAYNLGMMNSGEFKEVKDMLSSGIKFTMKEEKLTVAFTLASAIGASALNDFSFHPSVVWASLAGGLTGGAIKHSMRRSKIYNFLSAAAEETLETCSDLITSNTKAIESLSPPKDTWTDYLQKPKTQAFMIATAACIALDVKLNNGQITNYGLGHSLVTAKFWFQNAIQEIGLHGIFGATGAATGLGGAALHRLYKKRPYANKIRADEKVTSPAYNCD